ncbi:MAG: hypothetical protein LPD71_03335 [Shewanella sp.]|nr:hypothetical protein [Shewanella sp.]MCF1437802.1 hypothetical protein [Shewanella sp.]MCF1459213.1 hypothetical protein [Shewanella sp.]
MFSMTLNYGNGDPVTLWSPLEAVNGLAFMLAFGLGVPQWLSLLLSFSFLLLVCWIGYRLGKKVQTLFKA